MKRKVIFILFLILLIGIALIFCFFPRKKYDNAYFSIETYKSSMDQDHDGIDDQTDILENVKTYIATKPKYKSKYYAGGYPDDGYGVCTDVVGFGLLNAGYDLMELIYKDIKENQEEYSIEKIDKNIDFRRVVNLNVYFKRHAISLTTDIYDISAWQGGDIVVFKSHIGIVSDQRNKKGIPYIIHHYGVFQTNYEEDILEHRNDLVAHYRIS